MTEVLAIAIVTLVSVVLSLAGLALVRRLAPAERLAHHTDVAGYMYAVIGVIYAVVLALVVIAAWEEYQEARNEVTGEANSVLNLARMANAWPASDRETVTATLINYTRNVVEVEWPAMRRDDFAPVTDTIPVNQVWHALNEADETAATKSASYEAALVELERLSEARRNRLLLGEEGLPAAMTLILAIGAVVTVAFTYLFAVDDGRIQALMTASLAVLVALLLLLQHQLGRPFQGITAIEPTAMELVLAEIDSPTGPPGMAP